MRYEYGGLGQCGSLGCSIGVSAQDETHDFFAGSPQATNLRARGVGSQPL